MDRFGYVAPEGRIEELKQELEGIEEVHGRLVIARGPRQDPAWCHNVWEDVQKIEVASIGDAAKKLRGLQRRWALLPHVEHRRAALIAEQLPKVSSKPLVFPSEAVAAPLGSWMLADRNVLFAAPSCSSAFANGEPIFAEPSGPSKPASSAYLKLWEALSISPRRPGPGDVCLDLGACPGGWTWVLQDLGAETISVDKAPLDPATAALSRVSVLKKDAFRLKSDEVGKVDWLFSDIICYPEKLLELVQMWREARPELNMICTIKFQGETDFAVTEKFRRMPGSRVQHLFHNKHEVTWFSPGRRN
jgi:23S rRNA (cytidine2498-2'-O)-methyltransferase